MTKMNSQHRSLSAALDMVEAAISSLENQAKQAKLFQEQQQQEQAKQQHACGIVSAPQHQWSSVSYTDPEEIGQKTSCQEKKDRGTNEVKSQLESHKATNGLKITGGNLQKKHKSSKNVLTSLPGVLLQPRNSTPRKKSHKRSGSSRHHHKVSSNNKKEKNNNTLSEKSVEATTSQMQHHSSKDVTSSSYAQPTLASRLREQLTEKPKQKEKSLPFIPTGSQGKSYHVGVIIQKELGQLKSQPLEVWAAAKQNAARREAEETDSSSSILHRQLTKS